MNSRSIISLIKPQVDNRFFVGNVFCTSCECTIVFVLISRTGITISQLVQNKEFCNRGRGLSAAISESNSCIKNFLSTKHINLQRMVKWIMDLSCILFKLFATFYSLKYILETYVWNQDIGCKRVLNSLQYWIKIFFDLVQKSYIGMVNYSEKNKTN